MKKSLLVFTIVILFFIFAINFVSAGCVAGMSGGNTTLDPCLITNCTQLQNLSLDLLGNFGLANNINCSETTSWNSALGFSPIGTSSSSFRGSLNGQYYNITDLYIKRTSTSYIGLIGYSELSSNISNLGLINVNISGASYTGGLIGYNKGNISNSFVSGRIAGQSYTGGFAGLSLGYIKNSYSIINVTSWDSGGGFVGSHGGNINNSYSTGSVNCGTSDDCGGFIGGNGGSVFDSYSTASALASTSYSYQDSVGGFVGSHNTGTITRCYSTGNATGYESVGGFVGDLEYDGKIKESYATGNVYCVSRGCGGFVGLAYLGTNFINNSFARGNVTGGGSSGYTAAFGGEMQDVYLFACYATGRVSGDSGGGGFSDYQDYACANCFWDNQTTSKTTSSGGIGKTTAQMKNVSTYTNISNSWDFAFNPYNDTLNNNYWDISSNVNDGYPALVGVGMGIGMGLVPPTINITYPVNWTSYLDITELNYTVTDTNAIDSCWWSNSSGIWNSSIVSAGTNWTGLTSNDGWNNWSVYCNDTTGAIGSKSATFNKDVLNPNFTAIENKTSEYGSSFNYQINATDDGAINCFTVNDTTNYNINCSGYLTNNTNLAIGLYWVNITVNDTVNHLISAEIFVNVSDTTPPLFNNLANQTIGQYDSLAYQINATDLSEISCYTVNDTTNFNINCSGYLTNKTALEDYYYTFNITVNDSYNNLNSRVISLTRSSIPRITLEMVYPTENIGANYSELFNISVNVSCFDGYCGEINISLDPISGGTMVEIHAGNATSTLGWGSSSNPDPLNTYFHDARMQSVYLASDLRAAGLSTGSVIKQLYINVSQVPGQALGNFRIRMNHTNLNTTSSAITSWNTTAYGPTSIATSSFSVSRLFEFNFTNNFTWDGTSNIIIDFSRDNSGWTSNGGLYVVTGLANGRSLGGQSDSGYIWPFDSMASTPYTLVPKIWLTYTGGTGVKSGLVSMNTSATPFYTTTQNPYNVTLSHAQTSTITWIVNATGTSLSPNTFFVYANMTSNMTISNITTKWNVTIRDIVSPTFTNLSNKSIEYGSALSHTISASDTFGVSCYTVNDTTNFAMSCAGILTNKTLLNVGLHNLNITINDTSNNLASGLMWVNVSDSLAPAINIIYPANNTNYIVNISTLNYTVADNSSISGCWWSNSSGIWNSSIVSAGINWTGLTSNEGWNNWSVYCNDSYNNLGSRINRFFKDTILPVFNNLANQTTTEVLGLGYQINATDSNNISCFTVNDTTNFNVNCSGYLKNNTLLAGRTYWINITINDTLNNRVSNIIFVNVSDSNFPTFNNLTNQTVLYGNAFTYQINATDASGISCYTVNDTTNFNVNCSGYLKNNTLLAVGLYNLNITVNDTLNNLASRTIFVNATPRNYPQLSFISPTPIDGTSTTNTSIQINTSIVGSHGLTNIIYNWNGVNYTFYENSLVLMYNFDNISSLGENVTHVKDASINGNNGTLSGAVINSTSGKYGMGAFFDGINDVISVADSNSLDLTTRGTISLWAKRNSLKSYQMYVTKATPGSTSTGYQLMDYATTGRITFRWSTDLAETIISKNNLSVGNWSHLAVTYNGSQLRIYIDGVLDNSTAYSTNAVANTELLRVGARSDGYYFNGSIDEVRIWNRSLSAEEIYEQYVSNLQKFNSTQWYFYANQSKNSTAGLDLGTYSYQLFASDSIGFSNSTEQRTIIIRNANPAISIVYPLNGTSYATNISVLNYSVSSNENISACWYSVNNAETNSSIFSAGINWTGLTSNEGWNNWTVYCNDSLNNIGNGVSSFYKDTFTPNVTLNSPSDAYSLGTSNSVNVSFNCSSADNLALKNISLYLTNNSNGNFTFNRTTNINGTINTTNWTLTLGIGTYTWNCFVSDSLGNSNFSINRTITIGFSDSTLPVVNITYPINGTGYGSITTLNYSVSDDVALSACWYSNNSGINNYSIQSAGQNFTGLTSISGWNNWIVYCNDTSNNIGSNLISFNMDNVAPNLTLNSPALNYAATITSSTTNVSFNCSSADNFALKNISLYITNSSNGNFILNKTTNITGTLNSTNWTLALGVGNYTWNCLAFDSLGNSNWSTNRTIILQSNIAPNITLNYPTNNSHLNNRISILLNATASDNNGNLDNFTVWFYGGYPNGTYSLINITYNITNGTQVTYNWSLGSSGRYNWTVIASDGKANSTNYFFYFNLTNFSISCEAGGSYQQGALVLVQGTILNESVVVPNYAVNLSIYDSNNNLDANQNLTTASDGGFETSFANLSVGSYVLNATSTYKGYNETCQDTFSIGGPASFVLDKILSIHNMTNTSIIYNFTLRVINKGLSDATSTILTDSDSTDSPYNLENISANSSSTRSYIKLYERNSSTYNISIAIARVNATNSYSGNQVSANSSEIILIIPAAETEQQLTLTKNAYYNSENSTSVNYTISLEIVNSGGEDLTNITLIDSDLELTTTTNLNRTQNYTYLSSIIIDKAASNANKLFVKATATVNSITYSSNQINVRIPGYGGPADAIVNAPASVTASTSFNTIITIENKNSDVGQDFVIDYWITNENENTNYTSGQQTIYVSANGNSYLTATLTSPSSSGNYRFRGLVSWAGGTATAYDSFVVSSSVTDNTGGSSGSTGGSGGSNLLGNVIKDNIVCNPPYIRYGAECCLDKNNNSICDSDEDISTNIKDESKNQNVELKDNSSVITKTKDIFGNTFNHIFRGVKGISSKGENLAILLILLLIILIYKMRIKVYSLIKNIIFEVRRIFNKGSKNRLSRLTGTKVYSEDGNFIGKVEEIYLEDKIPKIYGWLIRVDKRISKKIGKKLILIKQDAVYSIKDVIILKSSIENYLDDFSKGLQNLDKPKIS
ncbi:hypothetical protein FJZ17_00045 [Candidatus Pacearchaeota archaeon]|nr:hypothetical protein [Candidatus Pacearchaeota archaeon]